MFLLCAKCWLIHKTSHGPWFHTLIGCISFWIYNLYYCLKYFLTKKTVAWAQLLLIQALETLKRYPDPFGFGAQNSWAPPKRIPLWVCTDLEPFAPGGPNKGTFERVKDGDGDVWWWLMGVLKLWSGKFRATSAEVSPISRLYSRGKSCAKYVALMQV